MTMTLSAGMPGIQNKIKVQRQMPSLPLPVPPLGFVTERIPAYARRLKYKPSDASPASYWLRLCMCMSKGSHMSLLCGMSVGCWMTIVANHIQLNQRYQSHTHTHTQGTEHRQIPSIFPNWWPLCGPSRAIYLIYYTYIHSSSPAHP